MPALLRGMAPLIPMVAGRGVKSNKGQPLQTYGQTATIEFAHFHSSQRGGHSSQRACKDKIYVILYLDLQRPNYICVPNLKVDQGRVRVRVRVRVVRVRELASRLRTCGTCRTLWWCTTRYAVVRKARKRLVGVARTYSTEAPGRTSKRSYRPIPNRNRNPDPDPDPDSSPNPNPSPSPNVASVGIGQREAKALYGCEHLLVRDRA